MNRWGEIKREYKDNLPRLLADYPRMNPYFMDWLPHFTPIESNVWGDIRYLGLPFLPQYPAGKYFIDFADPILKIGIEVDGEGYHTDYEKDSERQDALELMGWKIIRIPGKYTFTEREDYEEEGYDERDNWGLVIRPAYWTQCSEGILERLRDEYYHPGDI